jgi:hypothetical protein
MWGRLLRKLVAKRVVKRVWQLILSGLVIGLMVLLVIFLGRAVSSGVLTIPMPFDNYFPWSATVEVQLWRAPELNKPYWEVVETEFGWRRVVHNWQEKPGMYALGLYFSVVVIGMLAVLVRGKYEVILRIGEPNERPKGKAAASGTVDIQQKDGVIYLSPMTRVSSDFDDYALVLQSRNPELQSF